jgi:replicative DNA helicase
LTKLAGIENNSIKTSTHSLAALCLEASDRYEDLQKASGRIIGVPSGFHDFDAMTCGLQPGELIIIAARPSMGKTALALNMARNAAGAGYPVGFFSLEMSRASLVDRLVSSEAGVNSLKFRNGRFSGDDWDWITAAQEALHKLPVTIDDTPGLHYSEVRRRARRMVREHGTKILFIDYLQLMSGDSQNGRVEEVSSISRNLKSVARELNLPVICLSQLSRSCEQRDNKRPRLSDLRDSGAIEQDADVVAFIYRDAVYTKSTMDGGVAEVDIAKQRNGPTGVIQLCFHARTIKFGEVLNG